MSKQRNPQFLIVDDFSTMRRIIRGLLKDAGYVNVDEAEDGQVAFQKLQTGNFDCVITDINMPNMNGFELLAAIKEDEKLKSTPVMMITAESSKDHVIKAAKLGACAYIVKPFSKAVLEEKIHKIFQ
jgi:two-component system chemotaxis response regulator CheY